MRKTMESSLAIRGQGTASLEGEEKEAEGGEWEIDEDAGGGGTARG